MTRDLTLMEKKKSFELKTTHIIALGFVILIFVGSILLSLPFAAADGQRTPYIDALFTATTSSCDGACYSGDRRTLELFWAGSHSYYDSAWRPGCGIIYNPVINYCRKKDPAEAEDAYSGGLWI